MIYAITPNPALDLSGVVDELVPNEKMYVYDETRFPGGNAINAARVITALGAKVVATGFLGGGTGDELRDLLRAEGVSTRFLEIEGHTRTSITIFNKASGLLTRLSFPGPTIKAEDATALVSLLAKADRRDLFVIGGSLPPGFGTSRLVSLLRFARSRSIPCVVDVPGKHLGAVVSEGALLIKPNLHELQDLAERKITSRSSVLRFAKSHTNKVPFICVSSVDGGALLITSSGAWFGKGPRIKVRSDVGAGDSMVGAMAAQFSKAKAFDARRLAGNAPFCAALLRQGLAAAMAKLAMPGTQLGTGKQIQGFFPKIRIQRVE